MLESNVERSPWEKALDQLQEGGARKIAQDYIRDMALAIDVQKTFDFDLDEAIRYALPLHGLIDDWCVDLGALNIRINPKVPTTDLDALEGAILDSAGELAKQIISRQDGQGQSTLDKGWIVSTLQMDGLTDEEVLDYFAKSNGNVLPGTSKSELIPRLCKVLENLSLEQMEDPHVYEGVMSAVNNPSVKAHDLQVFKWSEGQEEAILRKHLQVGFKSTFRVSTYPFTPSVIGKAARWILENGHPLNHDELALLRGFEELPGLEEVEARICPDSTAATSMNNAALSRLGKIDLIMTPKPDIYDLVVINRTMLLNPNVRVCCKFPAVAEFTITELRDKWDLLTRVNVSRRDLDENFLGAPCPDDLRVVLEEVQEGVELIRNESEK